MTAVGTARRFWPVLILVVGLAAFFLSGAHHYLSCEQLGLHRETLVGWVAAHRILAIVGFVLAYATVIAFSVPGGLVMSIACGFLFGIVLAPIMIVIAATVGATVLFLIAKTALGDPLRAKAGPWLKRMEAGFQDNALSYLLILRLIPLFPFFVVNLVPAFLGVSLWVYFVGTFVGIIPGTIVFTTVGAGLGSVFDRGQTCTTAGILTPEIIAALIGLAILAALPVLYKKFKGRRP